MAIRSFDIFDTLLTRRSGGPESVFRQVGHRILAEQRCPELPGDVELFIGLRIDAEAASRRNSPENETTLKQIYATLGSWLGCSDAVIDRLVDLELALEKANIVPLPVAEKLIQAARASGVGIAFLSDMYLPSTFLQTILSDEGLYEPGDLLLVSGEEACSKRSGGLYQRLIETTGLPSSQIIHFGNDPETDVRMSRQNGIEAHHLTDGNFNRYEVLMDQSSSKSLGWGSLLAGTSRLTRLHNREAGEIGRITATVVAPTLLSFAIWLLQSARRKGIRKLVFISRDGYLLKAITDRVIAASAGDEATCYIYGGRQAFHLPTIQAIAEVDTAWLLDHNEGTKLSQICQRGGLTWEEAAEALKEIGFCEDDWMRPVGQDALATLQKHLIEGCQLADIMRDKARAQRELVTEYFQQSGLLEPGPIGFVDLGWHGNLERSFRKLLGDKGKSEVFGFYFGLQPETPSIVETNASTFLFGGSNTCRDIPFLIQMVETFCTAPHPPVTGYEKNPQDGAVQPLYNPGHEQTLKAWGNETVNKIVLDYTEQFLSVIHSDEFRSEADPGALPVMQPIVREVLKTFIGRPSAEEAESWGAFPYDTEQIAGVCQPMATKPKVNLANIFRALWIGEATALDSQRGAVYWPSGIERLTPPILKLALRIGRLKARVGTCLFGHK